MDRASFLRVLHVTGAVLLLGNVIVTGFWATFLYRRRDRFPFQPVARAIMLADIFTLAGGTLLVVSGILLVMERGFQVMRTRWLLEGIGMLALSTALWLGVLLPDQWRLERLGPGDDVALRRVFLRWSIVGWIATGLLLYGLVAMVGKY